MPTRTDARAEVADNTRALTLSEFHNEARTRFGPDTTCWAYRCPVCGHAASGNDVLAYLEQQPVVRDGRTYLAWNRVLAQNCIYCPADAADHGTTVVVLTNGRQIRAFDLA